MPWYPEAIYKKVARFNPGGSKAQRRTKGRGVVNHVAATEAASLFNYFNQSGNPCSHFYVRRSGTVEQYVDTDYVAPANLNANSTMLSIETQGGANDATADREPWTAEQLESLIRLHIWLHVIDGFPVQVMPDSKASSKGIGWHKLGINPWRVPDGELWSKSSGKLCPGSLKIAQIKGIIVPRVRAATEPNGDTEMTEQETARLNWIYNAFIDGDGSPSVQTILGRILNTLESIDRKLDALSN